LSVFVMVTSCMIKAHSNICAVIIQQLLDCYNYQAGGVRRINGPFAVDILIRQIREMLE
jgi:hypothetical protein